MTKIIFLILAFLLIVTGSLLSNDLVNLEDHEHKMTETPEVLATCTEDGQKAYYTCEVCFKMYADAEGRTRIYEPEATKKLPHNEVVDQAVSPTCTKSGKTEGKHCSDCGTVTVKQKTLTRLGHSYSNYISDGNATCIADGTETSKCDRCDEIDNRTAVDSKLGHSFTNYQPNGDATCIADGTKTAKCDRCDETDDKTDEGSMLAHTYNQENINAEGALKSVADCVSPALYYKSCVCGALSTTETFVVGAAVGHSYTEKITDAAHLKAAAINCQTKDTYWYDCIRCDSVSTELFYETENTGAHDVSENLTTEGGYHFNECTVSGCDYIENKAACTDVETDTDHKCDVCLVDGVTSHIYSEWVTVDENSHKKTCNCSHELTESHGWTETGRVDATHTYEGSVSYKCTCGATKSKTLAALEGCSYNQSVVNEKFFKSSATCESGAVYYKSCICGKFSNADDAETFVSGSPTGHSFGEVIYSWSADNSTCTATRVCSNDSAHSETETVSSTISVTPASCIAEGNTKYVATFNNSAFAEQVKNVAIFVADHTDSDPEDFVCDVCGEIVDDESATKEDYIFTVADNNPFINHNGGDADGLSVINSATNGKYYENSYGKTFTITVYAEEATVIDLFIMLNARWNGVTTDGTITEILLDGSMYGVKRYSSSIAHTDPAGANGSAAWITSNAASVRYATIALHEGKNVITFTRTSTTGNATNINICGITIASAVKVSLPAYEFSLPSVNPFVPENGGYTDVTSGNLILNNASNGSFYQNTYGKTFSFSIVAENATKADLFIYLSHAKIASDVLTTIDKLIVNGVDVTANLVNSAIPNTTNWTPANAVYIHIANVQLKAGVNEITFIRKTETTDANNLNIRGIKLVSEAPLTLADVYSFNMDTATGDQTNDPFLPANGGSVVDTDVTYVEGSIHRYGNGRGAVLTTTIYVESATTVIFKFNAAWRDGEYFGYNMPADGHAHISNFTVNGSTEGVTPSNKQYYSVGWNTFTSCELATIELKAGYNVISFTIADTADGGDNVNYTGISILSNTPVRLSKVYSFTVDTASGDQTNDPFVAENDGSNTESSTFKAENGVYRYGDGRDATLTTTLVLTEKTTLVYNFVCAWRTRGESIGVFTPSATTGGDLCPYLKNFTVKDADGNTVTDGVVLSDKSYNSVGWFTFTDCEVAKMTLEAGTYQISFTIAGDNMNYTGISIIANAPVALGKSE